MGWEHFTRTPTSEKDFTRINESQKILENFKKDFPLLESTHANYTSLCPESIYNDCKWTGEPPYTYWALWHGNKNKEKNRKKEKIQ